MYVVGLGGIRQFIPQELVWLGILLAISFTLSMLFPFYISIPLMMGIFIGLTYYLRKRIVGRIETDSKISDIQYFSYYCMSCGAKHNHASCPNCGSKMKKAVF